MLPLLVISVVKTIITGYRHEWLSAAKINSSMKSQVMMKN